MRPILLTSTPRRWALVGLLAITIPLPGCLDAKDIRTPRVDEQTAETCFDCHGDRANGNPAPPPAFWVEGGQAADAHQAHLMASDSHAAIPCETCHVVPATIFASGHIDSDFPAELTWSGVAVADEAAPEFANGTCAGTYCHGDTFEAGGGSNTQPDWSVVDGTEAACGTCHGLPPESPHPADDDCARCHGMVVDAEGDFVRPDLHVDGQVQVQIDNLRCDSCHGGGGVAAPPVDLAGNDETTARGVGAHREHLGNATWHAPVTCDQCHAVPESVQAEGHLDSALPAELTWGDLAAADGAEPDFDGERCSATYCHGDTLDAGGTNTTPTWTVVDGTQAACGTCHGLPPGGLHVGRDDCESCHGMVVDADGFIDPDLHIDGIVEVDELGCTGCHGSDGVSAPPVDTLGNEATTAPGVGAHRSHLGAASWHAEIACDQCHAVPTTVAAVGHADTALPAELTWGELATADEADPSYDGADNTCAGVYCHGATLEDGDGSSTEPIWTMVDGSQAACGTCHALPPGGDHPTRSDCETCHSQVIGPNGFVAPELHIDGIVEVDELGCDSCHGNAAGDPAPPLDTQGRNGASLASVGAHQAHLGSRQGIPHAEIACNECHQVPVEIGDAGHLDTALPAEVVFGPVATADSASPAYDFETTTCDGVYCHGSTLTGGTETTPDWTLGGAQAACGTCHGLPPEPPHPQDDACGSCHGLVVGVETAIINADLHINGQVDMNP